MAARLEIDQLAAGPGDPGGPLGVGKHDDAVGVADVELVLHEGHAEWRLRPVRNGSHVSATPSTIRVPQQRDAVCTHPRGRERASWSRSWRGRTGAA